MTKLQMKHISIAVGIYLSSQLIATIFFKNLNSTALAVVGLLLYFGLFQVWLSYRAVKLGNRGFDEEDLDNDERFDEVRNKASWYTLLISATVGMLISVFSDFLGLDKSVSQTLQLFIGLMFIVYLLSYFVINRKS